MEENKFLCSYCGCPLPADYNPPHDICEACCDEAYEDHMQDLYERSLVESPSLYYY